jgi:TonB family protein
VALLIHALFLLLLTVQPHAIFLNTALTQKLAQLEKKHPQLMPPPQQQPHTAWATVHQAPMPAGAPVVLVEENDPAPQTPTPIAQKQIPQSTALTPQITQTREQPQDEPVPEIVQEKPIAADDSVVALPKKIEKPNVTTYDPDYIPQSLFARKAVSDHTSVQDTKAPPAAPRKKQIDLATIASDFKSHGPATTRYTGPSMIGSDTAKLTQQQLRESQFSGKIIKTILASWRAHTAECPATAPRKISMRLMLIIQKNGSVTDVTLLQSTGNKAVDDYIIHIMKDTSTSMPPLPGWLNSDTYPVEFFGELDPRAGPARITLIQR